MEITENTWGNLVTGEIRDFKPRSPGQTQAAYEHYKDYENKRILYQFMTEKYGQFFFCKYDEILETTNEDTATAFRFLYLCTFADGETYEIEYNGRKIKKIIDFTDIFGKTEITTRTFVNDMLGYGLIYQKQNKCYAVNEELFAIGFKNNDFAKQSIRAFCNGIRELYDNSYPREHKMIGNIVKLLPFVNVYTNILCWNIEESNPEYIQLLTADEIAKVLYPSSPAYGEKKVRDLIRTTVKEEPVLLKAESHEVTQYYLNPRLFNRLDNPDKMSILYNQFDVAKYNKPKKMVKER